MGNAGGGCAAWGGRVYRRRLLGAWPPAAQAGSNLCTPSLPPEQLSCVEDHMSGLMHVKVVISPPGKQA